MPLLDEIKALIDNYQASNLDYIEELDTEPSPLEFMRYVARNRPFIVRGAARDWAAVQKWKHVAYLKEKMAGLEVEVAITPNGKADAPTAWADSKSYHAKPLETSLPFEAVIDRIITQEASDAPENEVDIWYVQTQNNNLRNEYLDLYQDVKKDISWARIALESEPDAINMWIGGAKSVTSLHRDPYENIYVQTVGMKHFVLVPPVETGCVNEKFLHPATWIAEHDLLKKGSQRDWKLVPETDMEPVPCAIWDPDFPEQNGNELSWLSHPLRAELGPGDMLYLPALWYHKVTQSVGPKGFSCSVNYWYDMKFDGSFYAMDDFLRRISWEKRN